MPRLFSGLQVPKETASTLSMMRGGLHGARWVMPDQYHVTVRFFGDVDRWTAHALDDGLACSFRAPFTLTISGLRIFGGDRPRALVAEISPLPALMDLQAEQERLARRLGLAAETRKYTPHITLARLRDVSTYQAAAFLSSLGAFPPLMVPVDRCVMFSARDQVGGGPYVVEAVYPFGAEEQGEWDHAGIA